MDGKHTFKLSDYDCIGFDLDHTLTEYHNVKLIELQYSILVTYLMEKKGYHMPILRRSVCDDVDFIRKGLILDTTKGNVINLCHDGTILRASHGTRMLSQDEIADIYGSQKRWSVTDVFVSDVLTTWNGPLSFEMRGLLDYFDIAVSILFARIVDNMDIKNGKPLTKYNIWPDILHGLENMFLGNHFKLDLGEYYPAIKKNPQNYIKLRDKSFLKWLEKIKQSGKFTFLVTGSNVNYGTLVAESSLCSDWEKYFDARIFYARKPGFFVENRSFVNIVNGDEKDNINASELKLGCSYSQGNWTDLYNLFLKESGKSELKCLYIGDNLIQDVYAPSKCSIDSVALIHELKVEECGNSISLSDLEKPYVRSDMWGSYFKDPMANKLTIWGKLTNTYSKICVPDLNYLTSKPLDFAYKSFCSEKDDPNGRIQGYHPGIPAILKE